ncbi:MAG: histone deacetylase [Elusimicrobiales bacterium]
MKLVATEKYSVNLGGHVFSPDKFWRAAQILLEREVVLPRGIIAPEMPSRRELLSAHDGQWLDKLDALTLSEREKALAEMPVTKETVAAHKLACGGTIAACKLALNDGLGLHAGGGGHHAFRDCGGGFCLFNDIAVAVNALNKRAVVIDLDAHQGNGTAEIFRDSKDVFTFSMHGRDIFPEEKAQSSLDIAFPAGTGFVPYFSALEENLPRILDLHRPELAVYLAGADVYEKDALGCFALSMQEIIARDEFAARQCRARHIPLAVVLGGGYGADAAIIHANTLQTVSEVYKI